MNKILKNLITAFKSKDSWIVALITGGLIGAVMFYFTEYATLVGNLGLIYANTQISSQIIIAILFGINLALFWRKFKTSRVLKESVGTGIGGTMAIIVSGCPVCGITLASYLGIASVFSALPLFGLELKLLGIVILGWSTYSLANNLDKCKIKKKK